MGISSARGGTLCPFPQDVGCAAACISCLWWDMYESWAVYGIGQVGFGLVIIDTVRFCYSHPGIGRVCIRANAAVGRGRSEQIDNNQMAPLYHLFGMKMPFFLHKENPHC